MAGLERTVVPLIAQVDSGLVSKTVVLSFLVSFGIVKALANLFAGQLADRIGRKPLLVAGWLAGLPVPLLIIWAPSWGWIVFANVLLGVNQGLCWSTTVIMKIDLVGPARRGLAMGLNEFAGYVAVSLSAQALVDTEQHVGEHDPAPARRPDDEQGHREPGEPDRDEQRLAADPVGELPGEQVGERFDDAKADQEGQDDGLRDEPRVHLGNERDDGALESRHRSDEGIDRDEQSSGNVPASFRATMR